MMKILMKIRKYLSLTNFPVAKIDLNEICKCCKNHFYDWLYTDFLYIIRNIRNLRYDLRKQ